MTMGLTSLLEIIDLSWGFFQTRLSTETTCTMQGPYALSSYCPALDNRKFGMLGCLILDGPEDMSDIDLSWINVFVCATELFD